MRVHVRTKQYLATAAALVVCLGASERLSAQSPAATTSLDVFYAASGTFSATPVSGLDRAGLAGQPFSLTLWAPSTTPPSQHGANSAQYTNLLMTGTVQSSLLPGQAQTVQTKYAQLLLSTGNAQYDVIALFFPVSLIGNQINITTTIQLPKGTLTTPLLHPFSAPVVLNSTNTVTYSSSTASTTLSIQDGLASTFVVATSGTAIARAFSSGVDVPVLFPAAFGYLPVRIRQRSKLPIA